MDKPAKEQVNALIDEILSRREFGGAPVERESTYEPPKPQQPVRQPREPSGGGPVIILLILGAIVLLIAVSGIGKYEKNRRYSSDEGERAEKKATAPPDPMKAAIDYANRGEYAGAVVCLYTLHLQQLQRQGWLVLEKSKTNLQYEFELMQGGYDDLAGFRAFKDVFNGVRFGGYGVEREAYETWLAYCRERMERRRAG